MNPIIQAICSHLANGEQIHRIIPSAQSDGVTIITDKTSDTGKTYSIEPDGRDWFNQTYIAAKRFLEISWDHISN